MRTLRIRKNTPVEVKIEIQEPPPVKKVWPWQSPLPMKLERGRKLGTFTKVEPDVPGARLPCPLCGRKVPTKREHTTRYYGSDNSRPVDEWDTAIIYECPVIETQDRALTRYHNGQKKLLTDDEVAATYQRHADVIP